MPAAEAGPATPSRHSSGSSTNPNTPRPTTPDQPVIAQAQAEIQAEEPSLSTSSSSDDRADIQTTRPQSIDVTKSAAVAVWGNDHRLSELFLDIHWHLKSNKAFFKLRATVALASQQKKGRRDGRTSVYLFIHPERICQLSLDDDSSKRSNEKKMLGAEMLALRFELNRPPAMILPRKESECEPKNKTSAEVLDALRDLACQTHFTICARIPRRRVSMARMQELCAEASEPGRLMSLEAHATLARLYQGQGGILVEGDTLPGYQAVDVLDDDGPPPEYGEPSSSKRPSEEPPPALFSDGKLSFRPCTPHASIFLQVIEQEKARRDDEPASLPVPNTQQKRKKHQTCRPP